jgi:ABC-2 type transport system ATP-binding protein
MKKHKKEVAIEVKGVYKDFRLPHEVNNNLKQKVLNPFKRVKIEKQHILKDISFDIEKGDFFGIIGRNGSGKSTLLKIIAEIYSPTKGGVKVNGSLTPFIELGVGFNPELTGRENVFLNGAMLGFNKKEMLGMYDEIVEFAELEKFMDQKLKNYSSGMQVRLAFSVAIRAKSDILLLDEVLAVGDYEFQQKCLRYFEILKKAKKTVILVSHSTETVLQFCNRAAYIEDGKLVKCGKTSETMKLYSEKNTQRAEQRASDDNKSETSGLGIAKLKGLKIKNAEGKEVKVFRPQEEIHISFIYNSQEDLGDIVAGIVISKISGETVFATNTLDGKFPIKNIKKGKDFEVTFKLKNIYNDGEFYISGAIADKNRTKLYTRNLNIKKFSSLGWDTTAKALVYTNYDFSYSQ